MKNLVLLFTTIGLLFSSNSLFAQCQPTEGEGRTWCIEFNGTATSDGRIVFRWTARRTGGGSQNFDMDVNVRTGDTAEEKAERFETTLTTSYSSSLGICRNGNTVCFRLKPGNSFGLAEVTAGEVTEARTGEEATRVYDPPATQMLGIFDIEGAASAENAEAVLQVGFEGPVARVSTAEKDANQIETELVEAFNELYANTPYQAEKKEKHIELPFVPCDQGGVKGGTTDKEKTYLVALNPMGFVHTPLEDRSSGMPLWMWIGIGVVALIVLILLMRKKKK